MFQILPLKLLKFQSETQKTLLRLPGNALWREKEHVTKSRTRDWSNNPEKVKRFYKDRQHVDSAMPKGTCSKQISRHHVHQVQCKRCCYLLHEWGHTTKTLMNSLTEAHIHCSKSYVDFGPWIAGQFFVSFVLDIFKKRIKLVNFTSLLDNTCKDCFFM